MSINILVFEDKLGITTGYEIIWQQLLIKSRLIGAKVAKRKSFTVFQNKVQLLTHSGNRKMPGFNPDPRVQQQLLSWVESQIATVKPDITLCMDQALTFIVNPEWNQSTIDNLRGGVYRVMDRPFMIMLPISAWHQKKSEKDIARLNEGFTDKEEWEEEHGGDETDSEVINGMWLEPMVVPYGKFVLVTDLEKAFRIIQRERTIQL